jgi:hypothetical protein
MRDSSIDAMMRKTMEWASLSQTNLVDIWELAMEVR